MYLNQIYLGGGLHGVEAAAQGYFGRSATRLTNAAGGHPRGHPPQPVVLRPAPQPGRRHPAPQPGAGADAGRRRDRRGGGGRGPRGAAGAGPAGGGPRPRAVLRRGGAAGAARALWRGRGPAGAQGLHLAGHGAAALRRAGARGADPRGGARRARALSRHVVLGGRGSRTPTAACRASSSRWTRTTATCWRWSAGATTRISQFDRVTQAKRQAGSAFKPIVYSTALAQGASPSPSR